MILRSKSTTISKRRNQNNLYITEIEKFLIKQNKELGKQTLHFIKKLEKRKQRITSGFESFGEYFPNYK